MGVRRLGLIGAGCAVALFALLAAIAAEGDQLLVTVDKPAIVTATPGKALERVAADQPAPRVIVNVTGYQPPQKGAVRSVVKVQKPDGTEQEIGSFGVFPDTAFKADPSRPRRYSFALPKELATGAVKLKVEVVPDKAQGTGEGARLELGGVEIQ
jgi:predicted RNase H-like nuclease